jgi:hypothetical protein
VHGEVNVLILPNKNVLFYLMSFTGKIMEHVTDNAIPGSRPFEKEDHGISSQVPMFKMEISCELEHSLLPVYLLISFFIVPLGIC